MMPSALRRHRLLLAALLIGAVAAAPLLLPGFHNTRGGGDSPFLLQRLQQLETALLDGHFPARWMPDANYGYGYPFFHYYAPLSIYVALVFRLLGYSYVAAVELAQLSGFLVAAGGAFLLARRWLGNEWGALLASAAYTVAPFHLVNVYVRGDSLAEFWAMAFYPLVLLAIDHLLAPGLDRAAVARRAGLLALAYAGLTLSHNISALNFSPFLLLYGLLQIGRQRDAWRERLLRLAAGSLLGLGLAAWFWLPALGETGLAQTEPITSGYFSYAVHFRGLDLMQTTPLFDFDVADGGAFRMGLLQGVLALGGIAGLALAWRRGRVDATRATFLLLLTGTATLLITPISRPLWDGIPLLPYTQFPWRFLSIQALGTALLTGLLVGKTRPGWMTGGLLLLLLGNLAALRPDTLIIDDADVTAQRLAEYEWFTGNIGTTVSAEYLPQGVAPRPFSSGWLLTGERDQAALLSGSGTATLLERRAQRQVWQVDVAGEQATLLLPLLAWPGWEAGLANGGAVELRAAAGSGLAEVTLPAGAHILTLQLTRTPWRLVGELIGAVSLLLLLALLAPALRLPAARRGAAWSGGLLLLLLLGGLLPGRQHPDAPRSWDFAQRGYLHRQPAGISFAGGSRLLAVALPHGPLAAGDVVTVRLIWETPPPRVALSLQQPGVNRFPAAPPVVAPVTAAGEREQLLTLMLPDNPPAGLLLPLLQVQDEAGRPLPALTATGEPRGPLFLAPLRVALPSPASAVAGLDVAVRAVTQPTPGLLNVALAWQTAAPLSRDYSVSLRLVDAAGVELAQFDSQPGYGYLPGSGWPAGVWIDDWLALPLPAALDGPQPYALVARLYELGGDVVLTRRLGELTGPPDTLRFRETEPLFTLPADLTPADVRYGDAFTLAGYRLKLSASSLDLTLFWRAEQAGSRAYAHFVHLVEPATGTILTQHDTQPRSNSYPTSQWSAGEIVADPLQLDLDGIPPGTYELRIGLYDPADPGFTRLPARGSGDIRDDGLVLPLIIPAP